MFERILFATDFSEASQKAAEQLRTIQGVEAVHVIHVVDRGSNPGGRAALVYGDQGVENWREAAAKNCADIAAALAASGVQATSTAETGDPADVILETADAEKSTVIVLGASTKGRLTQALLGSVSDKVVRRAGLPVLVIKH